MDDKRGPWYLITGLIIGVIIGVVISLVITPVKYVDTVPSFLNDASKERYRIMIAQAYQADKNILRAKARISLLGDSDPVQVLSNLSKQILSNGGSTSDAKAVKLLAGALSNDLPQPTAQPTQENPQKTGTPLEQGMLPSATANVDQAVSTPTAEPTDMPTPLASFTPRPSATAMPAEGLVFSLSKQQEICDASLPSGLLQVEVEDKNGNPIAGAQVNILWQNGEDAFLTGLYPDNGLGYADYSMNDGTAYQVQVGEGGSPVKDIKIPACKDSEGKQYAGVLWLLFIAS